jgi:hypothetical protein
VPRYTLDEQRDVQDDTYGRILDDARFFILRDGQYTEAQFHFVGGSETELNTWQARHDALAQKAKDFVDELNSLVEFSRLGGKPEPPPNYHTPDDACESD